MPLQNTELEVLATEIRRLTITSIHAARSGHPGGSLSAADLLAYIWGELLKNPVPGLDGERHRFVLSKGHACPALYAAAAMAGLLMPNETSTLRKLGSRLQGHPHVLDCDFAETSTGSLAQGFSVALGMALGFRHQDNQTRVYALLGDGELQEGEVWEAAMSAAHFGLSNLTAIIDFNKMQSDDLNENIMGLEPLADKWQAFGWNTRNIDGHDFEDIRSAFDAAHAETNRPTVIIAHTIKGKGVSYMEGIPVWHGSVLLRDHEAISALTGLGLSDADAHAWISGNIPNEINEGFRL